MSGLDYQTSELHDPFSICINAVMFTIETKEFLSPLIQLILQSAKLMGIDGEKAANLLFFLLGIDISQTDSLRSTLLLDFDSSIIEEESLVPSSEEDEDESSLHLSEMKSPHFKESHINPSHFEESHINPSHFEKSHINPSHFEESHINPRVLQQLFRSVVCDSMALGKPEGVISWITVIMVRFKILLKLNLNNFFFFFFFFLIFQTVLHIFIVQIFL